MVIVDGTSAIYEISHVRNYIAGYNVVVKIPAGATNIEILQHSYSGRPEDDNYLGKLVVSSSGCVVCGKFLGGLWLM